jgi:import inner membrane translocase subunit TIM54
MEMPIIPLVEPTAPVSEPSPPLTSSTDDASPTAAPEAEKPKEEEKPKKKTQPPPFNTTADYNTSNVSPNCPQALGPTAVVPLPHLLGFLNFPIRIYRFLNRRAVAEDAGRQTAAAVLAAYQPFDTPGGSTTSDSSDEPQWEQQRLLVHEEAEWHKSARERKDDDERERVWLNDMVLDPRIAERMRKFILTSDDEERAKRLASEKGESWLASLWPKSEQKKNAWEGLSDDVD